MSRCFPFPPPGYEIKNNLNLIIKEKHKLKKHKDKKDKDKKERSERKEGIQKDGKDRKQKKHRDEKDKKKDKKKISEEKKTVGYLENKNSKKLPPNDGKPSDGVQDYKLLVELGKRVRNDGGATDNRMVEKSTLMEQRQENNDGMLAETYNNIKDKSELSRMANGHTLKVEARSSRNGFVGNISGENRINVEGGSCQVDKVEKRKEGKEKNKHGNRIGEGDGCKSKDQDKKRKAEDKKRKKEKKKKKEKKEKERSKENNKQGANDGNVLDFRDNNPSDHLKDSQGSHEKIPKVKEPVLNGLLHGDNGLRPNNMSKAGFHSSPQSINLAAAEKGDFIMNQKVLESRQTGQTAPFEHGGSYFNNQNGSGFLHPSPQSIVNLSVEKGAFITNQKLNGKLSSSQTVLENGKLSSSQTVVENGRNVESAPIGQTTNNSGSKHGGSRFNNHMVNNGLISSHGVGEPCQTNRNLTKVKHVVDNCSVDDKFLSSEPPLENGRKMAKMNSVVDWKRPDAVQKMNSKDLKMNGILVGKEYTSSRPSSADDKFLSLEPLLENGRKLAKINNAVDLKRPNVVLKTDTSSRPSSADDKFLPSEPLLENGRKLAKINNAVDLKRPNVVLKTDTSLRPSSASVKAKEKAGISTKAPHPDLKYLSQILTVPRVVDLPQLDDEDWLFGSKNSQAKRPKLASSRFEWTKQVWAEAMQIESADVTVLPYVIPY